MEKINNRQNREREYVKMITLNKTIKFGVRSTKTGTLAKIHTSRGSMCSIICPDNQSKDDNIWSTDTQEKVESTILEEISWEESTYSSPRSTFSENPEEYDVVKITTTIEIVEKTPND